MISNNLGQKNDGSFKKSFSCVAAATVLVLLLASVLGACGIERNYKKVEKNAEQYYLDKYGKEVTIKGATRAGDSGLFDIVGIKDRAYELSDGRYIFWEDETETFYDTRQAAKICKDIDEEVMKPALKILGSEITLTEYGYNKTSYESFDMSVFHKFYDGDITKFLSEESTSVNGLSIVIKEDTGDKNFKEVITEFYDELSTYFSDSEVTVIVMSNEYQVDLPNAEDTQFSGGSPMIRAEATLYLDDKISWRENVYIDLLPGIKATSAEYDFVLEDGDVKLTEDGTASQLQAWLDEAGSEEKTTIKDVNAPIYRVEFSDRIKEHLKSDAGLELYVVMDMENQSSDCALWAYDEESHAMFRIVDNGSVQAGYRALNTDQIYYIGSLDQQGKKESE